ncbi:ArsR/SmtB family transcription factor [Saccharothrix syringae]|uniref:ArsR family transcriptional regulator n=1 Tax=Saccharothrix syringae TaxID=103733 RepID=A0A5Q0H5W8_SACSY|nr:helix-turn-helix domain-containing protein [Saccharothrix syringae]QFZ21305.1 ArsR family transcriptional regulator [Saccharothrix syringae]
MLRIHFTTDDLVRTTVAPTADPLWEVVLAGGRLRDRVHPPAFHGWLTAVRDRLDHHDPAPRLLHVLAPVPDLLTPPESADGLEAGLAALRATPPHRLAAELERVGPLPAWVGQLLGGPRGPAALAEVLRHLHAVLVEPHAEVIGESVNADRARRARDLVDGGVPGLLAGLRPHARWDGAVLEVDSPHDRDLRLRGRGLRLVPSYFGHRPAAPADPDLPPVLVYPISDADRWTGAEPGGLDDLLGPTRRAVLECARTGAGTTELARRVGTSPASVSRHTGVLRGAGLLRTTRHGTRAVHSLTTLGEALVAGRVPVAEG